MSNAVRNISPIRKNQKTPPYDIIIPAAGIGSRMKSQGAKPLLQIGAGITILQLQLQMIQEYMRGHPRIIVVGGFEARKVMNYLPDYVVAVENENYETTNVARSIGMGLRASTTNHVLILHGDLVFNKYALTLPIANESILTVDTHGTMSENEVGCNTDGPQVVQLGYGIEDKWAQIMFLTGKELELAKSICWNPSNFQLFSFEILNEIMRRGGKFKAYKPYKLKINDIDCKQDLQNIGNII